METTAQVMYREGIADGLARNTSLGKSIYSASLHALYRARHADSRLTRAYWLGLARGLRETLS